jgi:hypothetical protein
MRKESCLSYHAGRNGSTRTIFPPSFKELLMISTNHYEILTRLLDSAGEQTEATLPEMDHTPLSWETYMQATCECLDLHGSVCNKERRHAEDELGETLYAKVPYYTRQALVAAHMLFDKSILTPNELEAKMQEVRKRLEKV